MDNLTINIYYLFYCNIYYYIKYLLSSNFILILILVLLFLSIVFLLISIYAHKKNKTFISNLFTALFVAFLQIFVTIFLIEKIVERYQEHQWEKTKILINQIVIADLQDDLTEIVYVMDFSEGMRSHTYIEGRLEKNQKLTKVEAIYAANRLVNSLKLDDFADHYRYKKGEDLIGFQAGIIEGFGKDMETNLSDLDRIINFSQIKLSSKVFTKLIECRKEYQNLIKHSKGYSRFLSGSEITGELYDYNLKFEMEHRKGLFESIIKTINILTDILKMETFED